MKNTEITTIGYDPFFDGLFGFDPFFYPSTRRERKYGRALEMRSDIEENGENYVLSIELPGIKKEDIDVSLKDGYLTVTAEAKIEDSENRKYLHRERFYGTSSRSYYVGDVEEKDVKAKLENGTLVLTFPKERKQAVEERHSIAID